MPRLRPLPRQKYLAAITRLQPSHCAVGAKVGSDADPLVVFAPQRDPRSSHRTPHHMSASLVPETRCAVDPRNFDTAAGGHCTHAAAAPVHPDVPHPRRNAPMSAAG
jgi:hypothetical protein